LCQQAHAADKKLTREQLPARVLETVARETKGSTIKGFATEREHGVKVYEVETVVNGLTRDLKIAADGGLNEIEEEVALNALPQSVRDGLKSKAKGADVTKVEALTKKGKLVAYEAETPKRARKGSIQIGPSGGSLAHEE
jgi:hypothetical protein